MRFEPTESDDSGEGWHFDSDEPARRWSYVLGAAVLLAIAVFPIRVGQYVIPTLLVGGAIALLLPLFLKPREPLEPVRYDGSEGAGLLLPAFPMRVLAIAGFGLFGALLVVAGLWVGFTALRDDRPGMLVGTVIAVALGGVAMSGPWFGVRARMLGNQGVLLTEGGISLLSQADPLVMYWPAITGVRAHWTRGTVETQARLAMKQKGPDTFRNWLSFEATDYSGENPQSPFARTNDPTVNADDLGVDPHTVLAVCRYYIEHPEARGELATPAALDRVHQLGSTVERPRSEDR